VPGPEITRGKGEQCVADTDYMRRFHMDVLTHQRDQTVQDGVRTTRFSLKGCVACHARKDDSGAFLPVNAPGQFCAVCHDYTAVTIDCFQCHAEKPEEGKQARALTPFPLLATITPTPTLPHRGGGSNLRAAPIIEPAPLVGEGWVGGNPVDSLQ
jgi:hypothetical protein